MKRLYFLMNNFLMKFILMPQKIGKKNNQLIIFFKVKPSRLANSTGTAFPI